jgi:CubicO group peptidase (beta-lactamase class C family)
VRCYVPEFTLAQAATAHRVTVMNLANHTAGPPTRLGVDTGEGDDALSRYVTAMASTELIAAPGERPSYSQMGYNLLGLIIERALEVPFGQAILSTVLRPLRLHHSAYFLNDVITKRFAVGHNATDDGAYRVVAQWKDSRANNPGGGLACSAADLLRWSRFHLGDRQLSGSAEVLSSVAISKMQSPKVTTISPAPPHGLRQVTHRASLERLRPGRPARPHQTPCRVSLFWRCNGRLGPLERIARGAWPARSFGDKWW